MSEKKMMNEVKKAIKAYLDKQAQKDPLFAAVYAKPGKSIDECFDYIVGEVRKEGMFVYKTDQEIFGMAVHYYEEDDIKVSKLRNGEGVQATATGKHDIKLTEEEKAKIKQDAVEAYKKQCIKAEAAAAKERERKRREAKRKAKVQEENNYVASLFG